MRRVVLLIVASIVGIAGFGVIAACSGPDETTGTDVGNYDSAKLVVIDGVPCIVATGYRSTAISCDWANADYTLEDATN